MSTAAADRVPERMRGPSVWVVLLPVAAAVFALLAGASLLGLTRPEAGSLAVFDPGPWARWGLPVTRMTAVACAVLVVGLCLIAALVDEAANLRSAVDGLRVTAIPLALAAALCRLAEVFFASCDIASTPPQDMSWQELWLCLRLEVNLYRLVGAGAMIAVAVLAATRQRPRMLLLLTLAASAAPFLGGHSSSAANHELAVGFVIVHVLTASLWVGGLAGLLLSSFIPLIRAALPQLVPRFSQLALACAAATVASGIGNLLARWPEQGYRDTYLGLVAAKTFGFVVLCGFGLWHRSWLRRRPLRDPAFLRRSYLELAVMALVMALATLLASASPT